MDGWSKLCWPVSYDGMMDGMMVGTKPYKCGVTRWVDGWLDARPLTVGLDGRWDH